MGLLSASNFLFWVTYLFVPFWKSSGASLEHSLPTGGHNASNRNWRWDFASLLFPSITSRSKKKSQQETPHRKAGAPCLPCRLSGSWGLAVWRRASEVVSFLSHWGISSLMLKMATGTKMVQNEAILMIKTVMRTKNGTKSIYSHDNLKIVMRTRKTVWNLSILVTILRQ